MVIPKGKKFQFIGVNQGNFNGLNTLWAKRTIPANGYLGNAFIGQDINLNIVNNYAKPLESILDKVPHMMDLALRTKGIAIKNHRFTSMKFWTGTEPMDLDFQFIFETQVDSYYDVYKPVYELMELALPGENDLGFFEPPTPTLGLIAGEAGKYLTTIAENLDGGDPAKTIKKGAKAAAGEVNKLKSDIGYTGFVTSLSIGNNFRFNPILIKNVTPTFSSESSYAPLYAVNKFLSGTNVLKDIFNPYTAGEAISKALCQTIGGGIALGNNVVQGAASILSSLPRPLRDAANLIKDLPAFPMRAEVNVSVELQFPMVKSSGVGEAKNAHHINFVFPKEGFTDIAY